MVLHRQERRSVRPRRRSELLATATPSLLSNAILKLVLDIVIGRRDQTDYRCFLIEGVRHATAANGKFQMTTDGFAPYKSAVTTTLHDKLSGFAQLIKVYRSWQDGEEGRYSPAEVASVEVVPALRGQPDPERICTSIIERSNLSLRMGMRRFTRLTNAFSKKWENHAVAVMLWYCWYNFGRSPCWALHISRTPSRRKVRRKVEVDQFRTQGNGGDKANAAVFFIQKSLSKRHWGGVSLDALLPLAAHTVLMAGKLNPWGCRGLI